MRASGRPEDNKIPFLELIQKMVGNLELMKVAAESAIRLVMRIPVVRIFVKCVVVHHVIAANFDVNDCYSIGKCFRFILPVAKCSP
jgi:hypothetical protein